MRKGICTEKKLLALIIDTACEEVELWRTIARLIALLILAAIRRNYNPRYFRGAQIHSRYRARD